MSSVVSSTARKMEGDEPTKLADKWVEENKNISKFNQHVNKIIKNVRKAI